MFDRVLAGVVSPLLWFPEPIEKIETHAFVVDVALLERLVVIRKPGKHLSATRKRPT